MSDSPSSPTPAKAAAARRQFFTDAGRMACGVGLLGLGLGLYAKQARALPPAALRPPGAGSEADFLGACIRCGLCVRDCPYDTLVLAQPEQPVATGTPYFLARQVPCEMCEDIPCVKACPTGALDHGLTDINQSRMGLAVLLDQETCLNFLGLRCDVCYRVCPLIDKAITLELRPNTRTGHHAMFIPTVHSEHCTGCGKCEHACVLESAAAIKVLPTVLAKGELGKHYRLGWEEQRKAGRSLVEDKGLGDLPDRLPEGTRLEGHYDPASQGGPSLVPATPAAPGAGVDSLAPRIPGADAHGAGGSGLPANIPGGGLPDRLSDEAAR
ncbi:MAG: ferredoxin-type protein NapG [Polyangiaceae bacterium]